MSGEICKCITCKHRLGLIDLASELKKSQASQSEVYKCELGSGCKYESIEF